jgi:hypothetical protein
MGSLGEAVVVDLVAAVTVVAGVTANESDGRSIHHRRRRRCRQPAVGPLNRLPHSGQQQALPKSECGMIGPRSCSAFTGFIIALPFRRIRA